MLAMLSDGIIAVQCVVFDFLWSEVVEPSEVRRSYLRDIFS
jgi:hypothetical protein